MKNNRSDSAAESREVKSPQVVDSDKASLKFNQEYAQNKMETDKQDDVTSEEIDPDDEEVQLSKSDELNDYKDLAEVADNWDDENEVVQEMPK